MAFKLFVIVLLIFVIGNLIFFVKSQVNYSLHLRTLRKGLYTLFIGSIGIGLVVDEVELSNWQFILTLAAIIIFIDLAILLTPSIYKIFHAEFRYVDYVENIIIMNDKREKSTLNRVNSMSEMIQLAGEYFQNYTNRSAVPTEQMEELEAYLKEYADQYGFIIQIYELSEELEFVKGIEKCLNEIEKINSFILGENRQTYIHELSNLKVVSLLKDESMLVPVDMDKRQLIIVLKSKKGELLEVDALHIINLIYIFYIYTEDILNKRLLIRSR